MKTQIRVIDMHCDISIPYFGYFIMNSGKIWKRFITVVVVYVQLLFLYTILLLYFSVHRILTVSSLSFVHLYHQEHRDINFPRFSKNSGSPYGSVPLQYLSSIFK